MSFDLARVSELREEQLLDDIVAKEVKSTVMPRWERKAAKASVSNSSADRFIPAR